MLNEVLEHLAGRVGHDGLIALIGGASGVDAETRRLITRISQHNDVIATLVFDPLEAEFSGPVGKLVVSDGAAQLEFDTGQRRLRDEHRLEFAARIEAMREISRQRQIPLLLLSTAEPVTQQVRAQLGHRAHPRRV